ncbi:MAG: hypothetical protein KAH01_00115 [Caldisericia bacterium]|nr:hypothetical protein [Caldisericia bacterium]
MNFWFMLFLALFGVANIITGTSLWKRKPIIIDALKNQRITIATAIVAVPLMLLNISNIFYPDGISWIWAFLAFIILCVYFYWHKYKKDKVISIFYFDKNEFISFFNNYLRHSGITLKQKPTGKFNFYMQYLINNKTALQVEYSKIFSRFTLRFNYKELPKYFIDNFLQDVFEESSKRKLEKTPMACVYYLSIGISWIILCIWLGFIGI